MKYLAFIILFLIVKNLNALNFQCHFEEIYSDGSIQNGFMMIQKDKLRYEYSDEKLFTVLFVNDKLFYIDNLNRKKVQQIEEKNNLIKDIVKIYSDFPNIKKSYANNGKIFKIEMSDEKFIKRLAIKSNSLNVSIYFLNCQTNKLNQKYFNFNPFFEYE